MKDKYILEIVLTELNVLTKKAKDFLSEIYALEQTIKYFSSEEEKDEEPTIEDEIMSCLKDLINDNDLFKNVKIKVVKVDEDND